MLCGGYWAVFTLYAQLWWIARMLLNVSHIVLLGQHNNTFTTRCFLIQKPKGSQGNYLVWLNGLCLEITRNLFPEYCQWSNLSSWFCDYSRWICVICIAYERHVSSLCKMLWLYVFHWWLFGIFTVNYHSWLVHLQDCMNTNKNAWMWGNELVIKSIILFNYICYIFNRTADF